MAYGNIMIYSTLLSEAPSGATREYSEKKGKSQLKSETLLTTTS